MFRIRTLKFFRRVDEDRDVQHHSARNGSRVCHVFLAGRYGVVVVYGR
jgi:hypothetical protein